MGIKRGTTLGLTGVLGALIERETGLVGGTLAAQFGVAVPSPGLSWMLGVFVGVVAGDVATWLANEEVTLGRWAGIKKGLVASVVAGLGLYASTTGLAADVLGPHVRGVDVLTPALAMQVGSIWLGAVLGDLIAA